MPRPAPGAGPTLADPYLVFHPAGDCETGLLEIEVWRRELADWQPHPLHWRILADTCQREDAGSLLNELRLRCFDPARPDWKPPWRVGFSLELLRERADCAAPTLAPIAQPSPLIALEAPPEGATIRNLSQRAALIGQVDLSHELLVLIDASLEPETLRAITGALESKLDELEPLLGALRIAWLPFETRAPEPTAATGKRGGPAEVRDDLAPIAYASSRDAARSGLARLAGGRNEASGRDLAASLARANRTPFGVPAHAARRSIVVLANGRAPLPFGAAAGSQPIERARLLEQLQALLERGGALQLVVLGQQEAELAELVDWIRSLLAADPERGTLQIVARASEGDVAVSVGASLDAVRLLRLERLEIMNASHGILADEIRFEPGGRFRGDVALEAGQNRLRIEAGLSDGRTLAVEHLRDFDYSLIKQRFLEAERERIRRERERRGIVTIDAEER